MKILYNSICGSMSAVEVALSISIEMKRRFCDKKCCVIGFGRSNIPLVDMLVEAGALVKVCDKKDIKNDRLAALGVEFCTGDSYLEGIEGDYIFRSPGVRYYLPEIEAAVAKGAVLTGEMELFFSLCPAIVIGITGSDGKTTSTTLTHLFLQKQSEISGKGRAYVGGNIGVPLLPLVAEMTEHDFAVVELSSFQLQTMSQSPARALITNITPNHLDWHKDYEEYITAKCNICRHSGVKMLVTNAENDVTREIAKNSDLPITYFSSVKHSYSEIVPYFKENCTAIYEDGGVIYVDDGKEREAVISVSDILLPGRHNVENYMAAIGLTRGLVCRDVIREVARTFGGVPHRLELVRELDGVKYYNSSIDSSPSRTTAALGALDKKPVIICGGAEKGIPFDPLAPVLCQKTKAVILTGATAKKIYDAIVSCSDYDAADLPVTIVPDFRDAVLAARDAADKGDIVLLSPACTSFDRFRDFEERGNYFKEIVNELN